MQKSDSNSLISPEGLRAMDTLDRLVSDVEALRDVVRYCSEPRPMSPILADIVKCYDVLCDYFGLENDLRSRIGDV